MSRIPTPTTIEAAPARPQPLLQAVKRQLGIAPNLFRLVANSPAALEGHVNLSAVVPTDAQIIEIVQHVALGTWTNYFNTVGETEIDFPVVEVHKVA